MWTGRAAGDQRTVTTASLPRGVRPGLAVHRLHQVHGSDIVVVGSPAPPGTTRWALSGDGAVPDADAVVGRGPGSCAVVLTADCGPLALGSPEGVYGAVHVGWRGLVAGVIDRAVGAMTALGASTVVAGLGPTIHRCCYAFTAADLDAVARTVGDEVRAQSASGADALDLPGGIRAQLRRAGVPLVVDIDRCTACGDDAFSYRARGDAERQALVVWSSGPGSV